MERTIEVLLIEKQNSMTLVDIEQHLKLKFDSRDHARGFFEGYLFGAFKTMSLVEFQNTLNAWTASERHSGYRYWVKYYSFPIELPED